MKRAAQPSAKSVGRRNVTIQDVGSIGELVAAIATVVTLAYLATQIRQANRAARASSADRSSSLNAELVMALAQDAVLSEIYHRGLRDYAGLTDEERDRFNLTMAAFMNCQRNDYAHAAEGMLPSDLQAASEATLAWYAAQPGFVEHYWPAWRSNWPPEFVGHVDGIIANSAGAAQQATVMED